MPHRIAMTKLALESSDWLMVDTWEADRPKWLETIKVLNHFSEELNKGREGQPKIQTMLVCGSDLLDSFNTPNLWAPEDIKAIGKHGIVCISREGSSPENILWNNDLIYSIRDRIFMIRQYIPNDVSSTRIRRAISRNLSVKYLLPDPVVDYIHKHKLYQESQ